MRRLPPQLVVTQLELAEALAGQVGRPMLRQLALRRSVSTAYYAVFHALCAVCADEMVGWSRTGMIDPIYRTLDHRVVRKRLTGRQAIEINASLRRVGAIFAHLQDQRHEADYAPPRLLFSGREVDLLIDEAREATDLIESLSPKDERLKLAVLLIAHDRAL